MIRRTLVLALLLSATGAVAQEHEDRSISDGGAVPEGWEIRTDRGVGVDNVRFEQSDRGLELTLGPRLIAYRPDDVASGNFTVSATFDQLAEYVHAEAYGLFIGGRNLQDVNQEYTYFLIRGTGDVLVKRRSGPRTAEVGGGWTSHQAVSAADEDGRSTNTLEVTVSDDTVTFSVNGQEVYSGSTEGLRTDGIVGLRANHNLDLVIRDYEISRM